MFTKVLFPTDFSTYANAVFDCLPELKVAGMREVVLLYVIRSIDVPLPESVNQESLERVRWSATELLNIAQMALENQGLHVMTRIEYGSPAAEIVRVAEEEGAGLIFMGAQGATLLRELLLGSVASEVVRRATVPVLVQKFEVVRELGHMQCRRVCEQLFARVLHPTDFSPCAKAAFQVVKRLKAAGTQEVLVLHVRDERTMRRRPPGQVAAFEQKDRRRLDKLRRDLLLFGLQVRVLWRLGIPFHEVLKVAEEENPGLIVLGAWGHSAVSELLVGSTLESVVRLSRYPVLVVRCK